MEFRVTNDLWVQRPLFWIVSILGIYYVLLVSMLKEIYFLFPSVIDSENAESLTWFTLHYWYLCHRKVISYWLVTIDNEMQKIGHDKVVALRLHQIEIMFLHYMNFTSQTSVLIIEEKFQELSQSLHCNLYRHLLDSPQWFSV